MFSIEKKAEGTTLTLALSGRFDSTSALEVATDVKEGIEGVEKLVFDCQNLEYVSSAGLRVILASQKIMNKQGSMVVKNVSPEVYDIFEITGFSDILTIE